MRKRIKVLLGVLGLLLVLGVVLHRSFSLEGQLRKALKELEATGYRAKPLFDEYDQHNDDTPQLRAVRAFGTNALPILEKWISKPDESVPMMILKVMSLNKNSLSYRSRELAALGCRALGAEAAPLAPVIDGFLRRELLKNPDPFPELTQFNIYNFGSALAGIGTNSLPFALQLLKEKNPAGGPDYHLTGLDIIENMRPLPAPEVALDLIEHWESTGEQYGMSLIAHIADEDTAVAFLARNLVHADGEFRRYAKSVLSHMTLHSKTNLFRRLIPAMGEAISDPNGGDNYQLCDVATYMGVEGAPLLPKLRGLAATQVQRQLIPAMAEAFSDPNENLMSSLWMYARGYEEGGAPFLSKLRKLAVTKPPAVAAVKAIEEALEKQKRWQASLSDPDWVIRRNAADELGKIGADANAALPDLEKLATDSFEPVRLAALNAIKAIQSARTPSPRSNIVSLRAKSPGNLRVKITHL